LPSPLLRRLRILRPQHVRQRNGSATDRDIKLVLRLHQGEMLIQWLPERARQHGHAILPALALSYRHLTAIEGMSFTRRSTHSSSRSPLGEEVTSANPLEAQNRASAEAGNAVLEPGYCVPA
jgi:hypothetical protein